MKSFPTREGVMTENRFAAIKAFFFLALAKLS